jgi:hypothetical protein
MVIAHTGIVCPAAMVPALLKFYSLALAPLGYRKVISFNNDLVHGFGDDPAKPHQVDWWVSAAHEKSVGEAGGAVVAASHHAFEAKGLFFPLFLP